MKYEQLNRRIKKFWYANGHVKDGKKRSILVDALLAELFKVPGLEKGRRYREHVEIEYHLDSNVKQARQLALDALARRKPLYINT